MEAKWNRITDPIVVPTQPITFCYYANRETTENNDIAFNSSNETITIKRDFSHLKEISANVEKYAVSNGLTYEAKFTNDTEFTFRPFNVVPLKKDGIIINKAFTSTQVYAKDSKNFVIKLGVTSFESLIAQKYWQAGWDVQFLLQCKAVVNNTSKKLMFYLTCEEILFF